MLIDLAPVREAEEPIDFAAIAGQLRQQRTLPVAVRGGSPPRWKPPAPRVWRCPRRPPPVQKPVSPVEVVREVIREVEVVREVPGPAPARWWWTSPCARASRCMRAAPTWW